MPRKVDRLLWARLCNRPAILPKRKVDYRNSRAVGIRFERAVSQAVKDLHIGKVICGQWFEYCDANGHGYCQTDVLVWQPGKELFIIECKLTETMEARFQLEGLYLPVVRRATHLPVRGIIVARHLTRTTSTALVVDSFEKAMTADYIPILHWIGRGPIGHVGTAVPRHPVDSAPRNSAP